MRNLSEVRFPWSFRKSYIDRYGESEFINEMCHDYTQLHSYANRLEAEVYTLKAENLRLTHENEFMLKLINKDNNS